MNSPKFLFLLISLSVALVSCAVSEKRLAAPNEGSIQQEQSFDAKSSADPRETLVSFEESANATAAINRKIISSSEITLEVASPSEAHAKIRSIAAEMGGFLVTSETKQREYEARPQIEVTLVVRVPAANYENTLGQIRALASHVAYEKSTGQDVTEEFIDLEARIKTQKALETQFLQIMTQATKVADALEVQRQIADVRTEIEKLEGRRRFLENRASLSTISVTLRMPPVVGVNPSGFGHSIREALSTSVDISTGIVLLMIRSVIVLAPIVLFILLPVGLITRHFVRRARRSQLVPEMETVTPAD